jgi:hypothetical protein
MTKDYFLYKKAYYSQNTLLTIFILCYYIHPLRTINSHTIILTPIRFIRTYVVDYFPSSHQKLPFLVAK